MNRVTSFPHDAHWCVLGLAQLYPIQHTQWSSLLTCDAVSTRQPNPTCWHPHKADLAWVTPSLAWHSQQIRLLYTSSSGHWSDYGYQPVQPTIKTMQFSQWRRRADPFRCSAAGTAVASVHPRSPGSQTEGESEAPAQASRLGLLSSGPPAALGARRSEASREEKPRDPVTVTALPPPREPRSRRYPKHCMRAQPLAPWHAVALTSRTPRPPPTRSPPKDYSSHHATRGRATLTP